MALLWRTLFLMVIGAFLCAADLKLYNLQDITCTQGLNRCRVINKNTVVPFRDFGPIEVLSFNVEPALCNNTKPKKCLLIRIQIQILAEEEVSGDTPEDSEVEKCAGITLCYMSVPNLMACKRINFSVKPEAQKNQEKSEITVVVYDGVFLGSTVNVTMNSMFQVVHFPQLNSVCPSPNIEECKIPKIYPKLDEVRSVMEIKVNGGEKEELLQICKKRKGMSTCWLSDRIIPLHALSTCMCFQAWWKSSESEKSSRCEICPFENDEGIRRNAMKNMSFSVGHVETNEGQPVLSWNMSAPCRLEAEVWPCQMAASLGTSCREVPGFRRKISKSWEENITMVWTSDAFLDVQTTNSLPLCVMFKVDDEIFGPVCESDATRGRWILLLFMMLPFVILLTGGVLVLRSHFQEWLSNSNSTAHSRGLYGEVLLLHSSSSDDLSLVDTVCWFASWLSELGFSVSLDLWDQAAIGAVGPTPWLYSRLQHIQTHGGKTLLLLSHDAVLRARVCYESWSSVMNKYNSTVSDTPLSWNSDVFSSALSVLCSAHQKGSASERFALVQLESEALDIPELFQGLRLYRLPSESQRLLAYLHTRHPGRLGARLKRFLCTWRASVRLKKRLRYCKKNQRLRTESTLTQVKSLSTEEVEQEKLPLHN